MKIKIIFDTQTGTTQYVAELMQKKLISLGHQADLHSIRVNGDSPSLDGYEAVLFGAPTYEDGKLETSMRVFITKFSADLSSYKVAVFGLGNSSYPQFCTSAKILEDFVIKNNGKPTQPALKIDGFPDDTKSIEEWVTTFAG
jgi:flavodoxin I